MTIRSIWTFLVALGPPMRLKNRLLRLAGHEISSSARIMPSVIWKVEKLVMREGAYIGPGNVIRRLRLVDMEEDAVIGQLNWITADPLLFTEHVPTSGQLLLGRSSSITSRHYVDAAAGISFGEFSNLGGVRSTMLTHQLDIDDSLLHTHPITVGHHTLLGSNIAVVPGATIPSRCQVVMGAIVGRGLTEERCIYGGVPAKKLREVPDAALFERQHTWGSPWWAPEEYQRPRWASPRR